MEAKNDSPMPSRTISVTITAAPNEVYAFASNPENLPQWVPSFCKSMKKVDNDWVEVIFTLFRTVDISEEQHAADAKLVEGDLHRLKEIIERRQAVTCPTQTT